jgi:dienelactone hydrolase
MMVRRAIGIGLALFGLAMLYGAAAAQNLTSVFVPRRTLGEQVEMLRPGVQVYLPASATGPVPAMVFFHGCGGKRPMHTAYSQAIADAGFAAVLVDSFEPRGIGRFGAMTQVCSATRLMGQERAADVFAALEIARATEGIDPERLVLAGWSHGGWTLLDAMSFIGEGERPPALIDGNTSFDGVLGIVPIYPYCGFPARASGRIGPNLPPVEMILAERDMVAPHGDCARLARRAIEDGAEVSYTVWEGVTHAFDDTDAPAIDPRMTYNAEAAARLRARLIEILRETQD